jgi:hypothetical protein
MSGSFTESEVIGMNDRHRPGVRTTKQLAARDGQPAQNGRNLPSAAKAAIISGQRFGTDKSVPLQNSALAEFLLEEIFSRL